ncbi:hypothetical protein [Cnuella takakiae]|uniref:hypothetical protein n=1 Tax=Cnuella takakiae TaxID=1302690 RepID=UPI0013014BF4|nr:hypothetical protein [Cnuella takakiae]
MIQSKNLLQYNAWQKEAIGNDLYQLAQHVGVWRTEGGAGLALAGDKSITPDRF